MNASSLKELEKIKNKLEKWIKAEREFLDDYKDFYFKNGEYYFHISYEGIHKSDKVTKLKDLWDIKTGKALTDKEKRNIKLICEKIVNMENRLREVNQNILKFYLGDNFWGQSNKSKNQRNRISDAERIKQYLDIAFKLNDIPKGEKYIDKTMYRKLNDKDFLIKLTTTIEKRKNSNYNYSGDKLQLLNILHNHFAEKLLRIARKEPSEKKQVRTIEYNDGLNYGRPYKKKPKSPEY